MPGSATLTRDLHKYFGERHVLRGLNFAIPQGTTYGLVGPNGAGKTTLFRLLVGLARADTGSLEVLGGRPGTVTARAAIGYMTQAEALYTDLSVRENLRFFGRLYGLGGGALDEATEAALALVHLGDRAATRVAELSGGMRRRASLACAIVHQPQLLLLDEPTVGVDPELRAEFWDVFAEWARAGRTLIVSTHHLDEAGRCDCLGLLRDGQLIAEGPPAQLLEETGARTVEEAFLIFARRRQ